MLFFRLLMLIGVVICVLPLISVVASSMIASAFDCELHEGFANPCLIAGRDYGGLLVNMFVAGWLMLLTLPMGLLISIVWAAVETITFLRRRRGAR